LVLWSAGALAASATRSNHDLSFIPAAASPATGTSTGESEQANETGDQGPENETADANETGEQGQEGETGDANESSEQGQESEPDETGESPAPAARTK
jgi:hypothetical protein